MTEGIMLGVFVKWARQVETDKLGRALEAHVTESGLSDNPSARLDMDTLTAVARVTCWANGNYHAEVIDFKSEQVLYSIHGILEPRSKIADQLAPFFAALGITSVIQSDVEIG